jgi:Cof subfamily protein (haloacid dehalogenase superfamily)
MKMIVTDLDGTLLRSDRNISSRSFMILDKLNAEGVKIVIATARPPRLALKLLPDNFKNIYFICYNGAEIYNNNKLIYKKYINVETVKTIVDWVCENHPNVNLSLEIDNQLYTNFDISLVPGWLPPYTQVDFKTFSHCETAKVLVDLSEIDDISKVRSFIPVCCNLVVTDKRSLGQIAHCEVSKINAVKYLANSFRYSLSDVVAFGDDYNDMDIIKECGIGVAMGNAEVDLKEIADIIADTNDEDGVAKVLEALSRGDVDSANKMFGKVGNR